MEVPLSHDQQSSDQPEQLTILLRRMAEGDREAADQAAHEVYAALRLLARSVLSGEANQHSLEPTLLVNEAFMRLLTGAKVDWQNRQHFYLLCARMMRRIVVDYFRQRSAQKRPQRESQIPLDNLFVISDDRQDEILVVDEALGRLHEFDPRAAQVAELRYFAGRDEREIAVILDVTERTVRRDWLAAQLFLKRHLQSRRAAAQ